MYVFKILATENCSFILEKAFLKCFKNILFRKASQKYYIYSMKKYVRYANIAGFPKEYIKTCLVEQKMWLECLE